MITLNSNKLLKVEEVKPSTPGGKIRNTGFTGLLGYWQEAVDMRSTTTAVACTSVHAIGTRLVTYSRVQSNIVWDLLRYFNDQCMAGAGDCRAPVS
jgi:hypothetical protein